MCPPGDSAVNTPRISARALIQCEGRILLSRYCDRRGTWYVLPGGGQQVGEPLHACLIREVAEETSLLVAIGPLRWVREFIAADCPDSEFNPGFHQVELIFECTAEAGQRAIMGTTPDSGQIGLHWATVEELLDLRFYPHALAQILNGLSADRLYLGAV